MAALAGCASTPAPTPTPEGEEELAISAIVRTPAVDPMTGTPIPATFDAQSVEGVSCTLRNDKGTWTAFTPAKVRVAHSSQPLEVECAKEGFRTVRWKVECLTPREQEKRAGGDLGLALAIVSIPAGIVTLPVGGGSLLVQGAMGIGEHAYTRSRPDVCAYREIVVPLRKLGE